MDRYGCPHSISPKFAELVSSVFETILLITFLAISILDCGIDVKVETLDPTLDALNEICLTKFWLVSATHILSLLSIYKPLGLQKSPPVQSLLPYFEI